MAKKEVVTNHPTFAVGQLYKVMTDIIMLCPVEYTVRFGLGDNVLATTLDIKSTGQSIACGVQVLTDAERKANPGKFLMLTEGRVRFEYAKANGVELEVLVHAPYTGAQIFERNVSANGPKSNLSVMDIAVLIDRGKALGFSKEQLQAKLSFVAGRGQKQLHSLRYDQYEKCILYPADIQQMIHNRVILPDAALNMANRVLTSAQFESIVNRASDSRKREAAEQHARDLAYAEREKDKGLAAIMKGELPPAPEAPPTKKRIRAEVSASDPLNTADLKQAAEDLGLAGKNKQKPAEAPASSPLTHDEWLHVAQQVRERGGVMIEVGNLIEMVATRKISEAEFCTGVEAIIGNGSPKATKTRRANQEKAGKSVLEPVSA